MNQLFNVVCVSGIEEFTERPLKLVLKVAGNEVTTGSPSLESVHDDQVDYDKHNKKKKKKKKDEKDRASPPVSPADKKKKVRNENCFWLVIFLSCLCDYYIRSNESVS